MTNLLFYDDFNSHRNSKRTKSERSEPVIVEDSGNFMLPGCSGGLDVPSPPDTSQQSYGVSPEKKEKKSTKVQFIETLALI